MSTLPTVVPVILCGGVGTRLWPLSRHDRPKPFHGLGAQLSLLQRTLRRWPEGSQAHAGIVVAGEEHRFLVAQQLLELGQSGWTVMLESAQRNTAPALTLAALALQARGQPEALMLATPADHELADDSAFRAAVEAACTEAVSGAVVLFGVRPERPHTGYGYLQAGDERSDGLRPVHGFVEKPPAERARHLWRAVGSYWNSGLCLLRADIWLTALARWRPDVLQTCQAAMRGAHLERDFWRPAAAAFERCPAWSLDHAVLEPLAQMPQDGSVGPRLLMRELDCGWSDLGTWDEVLALLPRDAHGNAGAGPHAMLDCEDTLLLSGGRLLAAVGLRGVRVVETPDAVLVAGADCSLALKELVESLASAGHSGVLSSQTGVQRPWGAFDVVGRGENWLVKRLQVRPDASLSLQRHRHRMERWVVLRGVAEVQCEDRRLRLEAFASTVILPGEVHRLSNPGPELLEILELQTGNTLSEDDIERLDDSYGRAATTVA